MIAPYQQMPRAQLYATMAGLLVSILLAALDQTIVSTAMPRIVADLKGFEHYAWATTAYLLTSTAVVPIVGKLSDMYGSKRFLIGGSASFVVASVLCGLAQDMTQLAVFRGIQGIGGGMIFAIVMTVSSALFPPAQRAKVQGIFSATFGISSVAGPLLGGFLTDTFGWRSVFLVNVPVGAMAIGVLWFTFTDVGVQGRKHALDYVGSVLLVIAVFSLLLALTWGGHDYEWGSATIIGLFVLSLVTTVAFLFVEHRAAEPILPLELFKVREVTIAAILGAMLMAGNFGAGLFVPLFIQAVIGTSASQSGTVLAPLMISMVIASIGCGQIVGRVGRYKNITVAGVIMATVGMYLLSAMDVNTDYWVVVRNMIVLGFGMGATFPCFNLAAQNAVELRQIGVVTALVQFIRSIGATVFATVLGSMLAGSYAPALQQALPAQVRQSLPPEQIAQISNPQALLNPEAADAIRSAVAQLGAAGAANADAVLTAIRLALAASLHNVFLASAVIMTIACFVTLLMGDVPLRRSYGHEAESPEKSLVPQPVAD
jgi:EmrB/QacA subfamily drug resistance transporter